MSVNDYVLQIVKMTPAEQYDLAFKVAENIGYALCANNSDGRHVAGGMQTSATEGAITQRPAHPKDTISGGPIGPSERLLGKLTEIHDITQDPHVSAIDKIDNIAATAASALSSQMQGGTHDRD